MLERLFRAERPQEARAVSAAPVAIVDIGSNSVRLVAYQSLSRALTPIFNEKVMCALGKGVLTTGHLPEEGVDKALKALRRYRALLNTCLL
ncbi:MAG: exopolyphosphatase, partial [Methylocystis sp.]|nr:exopolyphosphatase [Methylocystis sp.]